MCLISCVLFRLGHHHFTELIEVHGSGAVLIKLLEDSLELLLGQGGEQLANQTAKSLSGDVSQTLLVIYPDNNIQIANMYRRSTYVDIPESILQLPLHGLHVRVLHQEGGAQLTELSKLDLSGAVLVNLEQQLLELLLGGSEAHGPHDLAQVISGEEILLLGVEQIKANLEEYCNVFTLMSEILSKLFDPGYN